MATNEITMKPKGGRGKRADYNTVQVRCPEPIKAAVVNLINQWHLGGIQQSEQPIELMELQAEIETLKKLNQNLNIAIEELKKQKEQLDAENLKLDERTRDLILEIDALKSELAYCKQSSL
jgi:predicted nuclease with TOPRIM domain